MCLAGTCGLRKTFGSLSADVWGCVLFLLLVICLKPPRSGASRLLGGARSLRKWQPSGGRMLMRTPQNCCHQCLCPCGESSLPPTLSEALPIPEGMSGPDCYVTFYPLCPGARDLMYSLQEWFLFPPVLWNSCALTLLDFKSRCSGGLVLLMPDPGCGT